ncbi:hypothetical protein WDZ92_20480 [Nostoc sp. NIES-2111]
MEDLVRGLVVVAGNFGDRPGAVERFFHDRTAFGFAPAAPLRVRMRHQLHPFSVPCRAAFG